MTGAVVTIRPLAAGDAQAFRALRIAALSDVPEAFTASAEEEVALTNEEMVARAVPPPPSIFFGAFADGVLVGIAGYAGNSRAKTRHKGIMIAVYVAPDWRAAKLGRRLVETVIEHARALNAILHCTVRANNEPARRLYRSLGFVAYGLERDAVFVDGRFLDDELLALDLREAAAGDAPTPRNHG